MATWRWNGVSNVVGRYDVRSIMGIAQQGCHQMAPDALLD
jgi:hypothetical protein